MATAQPTSTPARSRRSLHLAKRLPSAPHPIQAAAGLLDSMYRYWDLSLGGLLYGAGIWVDKWLMWAAPEHSFIEGGLYTHPTYDTAAFVAYITTVPALAVFIIQAETTFHQRCAALYGAIRNHADRKAIDAERLATLASFRASMRDVGVLQLCATLLVIILPTLVLDAVGAPHLGVFAFRFCALGSAFQLGILALTIVLYYFDSRRAVLQINGIFLLSNFVFTGATLMLGLRWYGFGYFVAALGTFVWAYIQVMRTFRDLIFLAFVRQNAAVVDSAPPRLPTTSWRDATTGPEPLDLQP